MPITTTATANYILNRVAAEVGIEPTADPFASTDPSFVQMRYLLNTAGEELVIAYPWNLLTKEHSFTTSSMDSGDYPLPTDFLYMINQTGWERSQQTPLFGPLSPQEWQYLLGRNLTNSTIYASFRLQEGLFRIFPQPPPNGLDIHYEYVTKYWVSNNATPIATPQDQVLTGTDVVLYDRTLISRYLKVKFLEAKGFDSQKAQDDFNQQFAFITGSDKGAPILNAGLGYGGIPYLNTFWNLPSTGYGNP